MKTLYHGGNIHTLDPLQSRPQALVIDGERIVATGGMSELQHKAGPSARRVHLAGNTLIPGFNDNHIHAAFWSFMGGLVNLRGLDGPQIAQALKEAIPQPKPGELIFAGGWDYPACPNPHKSLLDEVFPDNPVLLSQYGGHAYWMNSKALRRYGVKKGTQDPPGGQIVRDENGETTGVIREFNHWRLLFRQILAYLSPAWAEKHFRVMLPQAAALGLTSIQDNTWFPPHVTALRRLAESGDLSLRFSCWAYTGIPLVGAWMRTRRFQSPLFHLGPDKFFLDGTFTTRTAWITGEYADEPGNSGKPGMNEGKLASILERLARNRRQGAFHAIGDRTIQQFLDVLENVARRYPQIVDLRLRLEHAQLIRDEDIPRLRDLGVCICAQPHAMANPEKDRRLLGAHRVKDAYPYRKLLDAGVNLSFGSDHPGEDGVAPLVRMQLAVDRDNELAVSAEEALSCYTAGSAFAEGMEDRKGRLKPGYLADMVILDDDPLSAEPSRIGSITVRETILGGRSVYRAP